MSSIEEFVQKIAGFTTYDEAVAKAGDDPDKARNIHEEFLTGIEDDWSDMVLEAREIIGGEKA
jgi:hypothetical protein